MDCFPFLRAKQPATKAAEKTKKNRILLVGLSCAGKTEFLQTFTENYEFIHEFIGKTIEKATYKSYEIYSWDQNPGMLRPIFRQYYVGVKGILYFFDSRDDSVRMNAIAASELELLVKEKALQGVPLVVFANKMDMPDCMSVAEVVDRLKLNDLKNVDWTIYSGSIKNREGIEEAFEYFDSI